VPRWKQRTCASSPAQHPAAQVTEEADSQQYRPAGICRVVSLGPLFYLATSGSIFALLIVPDHSKLILTIRINTHSEFSACSLETAAFSG
jgi:hypothetical protein